jgi:hypothetical protein
MASVCVAAGMSPSEYKQLSLIELEEFIKVLKNK